MADGTREDPRALTAAPLAEPGLVGLTRHTPDDRVRALPA